MLEQDKRHLKKQLTFIEATQQIPQSVRTACALPATDTARRKLANGGGQGRRPGRSAPRGEAAGRVLPGRGPGRPSRTRPASKAHAAQRRDGDGLDDGARARADRPQGKQPRRTAASAARPPAASEPGGPPAAREGADRGAGARDSARSPATRTARNSRVLGPARAAPPRPARAFRTRPAPPRAAPRAAPPAAPARAASGSAPLPSGRRRAGRGPR